MHTKQLGGGFVEVVGSYTQIRSTNIQTPTTLGWGFFLCAPARPREHARNAE